jgi:hypothetical protein
MTTPLKVCEKLTDMQILWHVTVAQCLFPWNIEIFPSCYICYAFLHLQIHKCFLILLPKIQLLFRLLYLFPLNSAPSVLQPIFQSIWSFFFFKL